MDTLFLARAEDQTFRIAYCQNCQIVDRLVGKLDRQLSELERQPRTKTEVNEGLQAKLAKATAEASGFQPSTVKMQEEQKKRIAYLERNINAHVHQSGELRKEIDNLRLKLKEQDKEIENKVHETLEYSRSEKEMKQEIGILKFKLEEEKKRNQELLNQKSATDAKTQQLENEARNKDTRIIELERKIKNSEAAAKESGSKYSNTMVELDGIKEKHKKLSAES